MDDLSKQQIKFADSENAYTISNLINNQSYTFIKNKATAITIIPITGYNVSYSPAVINQGVASVSVIFTKSSTDYKTVQGWPNYIAMGAVTDANTSNNGGLDNRMVDSIFKYSGDGGNGDPAKIVFPIYTMNTLAVAKSLTEQFKHNVMPTMVMYTAEMSGGTAFKDLGYDQPSAGSELVYQGPLIPAMHFINLLMDAKTLQNAKTSTNPYPGSIIINPDLLGMVQQQKLYSNGPLRDLKIPVKQSLAQAVCFINRDFGPT